MILSDLNLLKRKEDGEIAQSTEEGPSGSGQEEIKKRLSERRSSKCSSQSRESVLNALVAQPGKKSLLSSALDVTDDSSDLPTLGQKGSRKSRPSLGSQNQFLEALRQTDPEAFDSELIGEMVGKRASSASEGAINRRTSGRRASTGSLLANVSSIPGLQALQDQNQKQLKGSASFGPQGSALPASKKISTMSADKKRTTFMSAEASRGFGRQGTFMSSGRPSIMASARTSSNTKGGAAYAKKRAQLLSQDNEAEQEMEVIVQVKWIDTTQAQAFFATVICVNAVCLAIETDTHTIQGDFEWGRGQDFFWLVVETIFLIIFIVELSLRLQADGVSAFRDPWNCLDLLLITIGIFDAWICQVILAGSVGIFNASFLRIMRLLRLARVAKVFKFFRILYLLIEGVLNAMKMIIWFVLLLILVLFTTAIFCTVAFGKSKEKPAHSFRNVPISMLTLFQIVTLESWPVIYEETSEGHPAVWIFFVLFIFFANFVLLNMMTGVIVEHVLSIARSEDEERERVEQSKRTRAMENLKIVFQLLDRDNSGRLSQDELQIIYDDPDALRKLESLHIPADQMLKMFKRLDINGEGEIVVGEFIDSCLRFSQGGEVEKSMLDVQYNLKKFIDECLETATTKVHQNLMAHESDLWGKLEAEMLSLQTIIDDVLLKRSSSVERRRKSMI